VEGILTVMIVVIEVEAETTGEAGMLTADMGIAAVEVAVVGTTTRMIVTTVIGERAAAVTGMTGVVRAAAGLTVTK